MTDFDFSAADIVNNGLFKYNTNQQEMYGVRLSWWSDDDEDDLRPEETYIFATAEQALSFAYNIAYTGLGHEYGDPIDVYIVAFPVVKVAGKHGEYHHDNAIKVDGEGNFVAMYHDVNHYLKNHELR